METIAILSTLLIGIGSLYYSIYSNNKHTEKQLLESCLQDLAKYIDKFQELLLTFQKDQNLTSIQSHNYYKAFENTFYMYTHSIYRVYLIINKRSIIYRSYKKQLSFLGQLAWAEKLFRLEFDYGILFNSNITENNWLFLNQLLYECINLYNDCQSCLIDNYRKEDLTRDVDKFCDNIEKYNYG